MLTVATLGLLAYGAHAIGTGFWDLFVTGQLEPLAAALLILGGGGAMLSAAFVRAGVPGGLELAVAMLLALQGLALYHASHAPGGLAVMSQVGRALYAAVVLGLCFAYGWRGRGG